MSACPHVDPSQEALAARGVRRGWAVPVAPPSWRLSVFAGRLGEISADQTGAALTLVFRLVLDAQQRGEPVAWVSRLDSTFFPPDAVQAGIDLAALAVIRVRDARQAVRAADYLVRSGAFGLITLDLGRDPRVPIPVQSRLVGLAKKHDSALLCLTEKDGNRPSLGSLISVRAQAVRTGKTDRRFHCEARILKDKRQGPGWTHKEVCNGPAGLR